MSDIQRWHLQGLPGTTGIVDVMSYADHVAAVAAEYERGVSDERARIRTAVQALHKPWARAYLDTDVLTAIGYEEQT